MYHTTPHHVNQYAKDHGYKLGAIYVGEWNGHIVYIPDYSYLLPYSYTGLPNFILTKGETMRWCDNEERHILMRLNRSNH